MAAESPTQLTLKEPKEMALHEISSEMLLLSMEAEDDPKKVPRLEALRQEYWTRDPLKMHYSEILSQINALENKQRTNKILEGLDVTRLAALQQECSKRERKIESSTLFQPVQPVKGNELGNLPPAPCAPKCHIL